MWLPFLHLTPPTEGVHLGQCPWNFPRMSLDGQCTKMRSNIAENFNRLSRVHERYGQTDRRKDGRQHIANSCSRSLRTILPSHFVWNFWSVKLSQTSVRTGTSVAVLMHSWMGYVKNTRWSVSRNLLSHMKRLRPTNLQWSRLEVTRGHRKQCNFQVDRPFTTSY